MVISSRNIQQSYQPSACFSGLADGGWLSFSPARLVRRSTEQISVPPGVEAERVQRQADGADHRQSSDDAVEHREVAPRARVPMTLGCERGSEEPEKRRSSP